MPFALFQSSSIPFLALSIVVSLATLFLARAHLVRVARLSSRQTISLTQKLARLPMADRMSELRRLASPASIEWRIADDALQVDEAFHASAVDSVLADVALELESRATWPRAAIRIAGASGVLLMALAISLHLEVVVAVIVLLMGIFSALVCMSMERRALAISQEIRRRLDALVDVLALRDPQDARARSSSRRRSERRSERRSRHRRAEP